MRKLLLILGIGWCTLTGTLRAQMDLPVASTSALPLGHSYIIGLNVTSTDVRLFTIAETWDSVSSIQPLAWVKSFDPTLLGAGLSPQSLISADANTPGNFYYSGGLLGPTLYDFTQLPPALAQNAFDDSYTNVPTGLLSTTAGVYWARSSADGGGIDFYSAPLSQTTPSLTFAQSGPGALPNGGAMALGPDGLLYVADATTNRIVSYNPATGAYVSSFAIPAGVSDNTLAFNSSGLLFMADFNENDGGYIYDAATGAQEGTFDLPLDINAPSNGGSPALFVNGDTLYATSGSGQDIYTFDLSQVPEPSAICLWIVGGALSLTFARRRSPSFVEAIFTSRSQTRAEREVRRYARAARTCPQGGDGGRQQLAKRFGNERTLEFRTER